MQPQEDACEDADGFHVHVRFYTKPPNRQSFDNPWGRARREQKVRVNRDIPGSVCQLATLVLPQAVLRKLSTRALTYGYSVVNDSATDVVQHGDLLAPRTATSKSFRGVTSSSDR